MPSALTVSIAAPADSRVAMTRCSLRFDRVHQRGPPLLVTGVHIGAGPQEHVHCGMISSPGGDDDRWRAVGTPLVDVRSVRQEEAQNYGRDGLHDRGDQRRFLI
jgi:hypothetical protein